MEWLFLKGFGLIRVTRQKIGNKGRHAPVNLRKKLAGRWIERIIQVKDPGINMGQRVFCLV